MENNNIVLDVVSIIAVIVAPIISVCIGQFLQDRAEKRKDKMELFKALMTSRTGWTVESVKGLNILDVVFSEKKDKPVRDAWKIYYDRLCTDKPSESDFKKIRDAQYKLLEAMAVSLGYKDKITWETIQNPYVPNGMVEAEQKQNAMQDIMLSIGQMIYQPGNGNDTSPTNAVEQKTKQ